MPRLSPCPSCDAHVFVDEQVCPHCGAPLRTSTARVPALLMGLALTGCPVSGEPVYGVPDSGPSEAEAEESESGTDTTDETTSVGEPEYGVPDSG